MITSKLQNQQYNMYENNLDNWYDYEDLKSCNSILLE